MASQVQLTNTFNEFRQAYNGAANDITQLESSNTAAFSDIANNASSINTLNSANSALYNSTAEIKPKSAQVADLNITGSRVVFGTAPISGTGAVLSDDDGFIYHSGNNSAEISGSISTGNNANIGGTLDVTSTSQLDGTVTVGSNAAIIVAANGTFISPSGNVTLNTTGSRIDAFDIHAENRLDAGVDLEGWATAVDEDLSIHRVISVDDVDGASDHAVINRNDGIDAYAELIAMNDVGNSEQGWISMGINSSNYGQAQYAVTKNDDGYILYQPPEGTSANGDLVIGTGGNGTKNRILFSANGFDVPEDNTQMTITPGESVRITINTESANSSTGALVVQGGIGLTGNLNVGGNVAITGTITLGGGGNTVSTSSLTVDSPIIFLGANNAADTFDLGFVGEYTDGVEKYSGLVRDASDGGTYKLFANTDILPANTVDFTDVNLVYSGVQVGSARIVDATASSSNTTGALIVTGGVGISGEIHTSGLVRATDTTTSTSTSTGAVVVSGGVGVAGNTHIGTNLIVGGTANITGAIISSGAISDSKGNLRTVPPNAQTGAYTLVIGDVGKFIDITTGGVTVPQNIFSAGDVVTIYNDSASSQTITQGTGVTLRLAGTSTTGNRTLVLRGVATLLCVASNEFVINGGGLT
jgi:hypothetical protein